MSISYIIHVAILITIFYGAYQLLLSKSTFFDLNRFVLTFGIFACFLLPFIPAPIKLSVSGKQIQSNLNIQGSVNDIIKEYPNEPSKINGKSSIQKIPEITFIEIETKKHFGISLLPMIYLLGVLILFANLLIQFINIAYKIIKHRSPGSNIVNIPTSISPCSFFGYTLLSSDMAESQLKQHVLKHEKVHNDQWHSLDIILAELMVVLQWFNPFAWLYRRSIESNLEFVADSTLVDQNIEKKKYQYNLLQLAVPNFPLSIVTNYNQTLIKKRITMMNTKKSSTRIGWKYLLYLPIMIFTITLLNPASLEGLNILDKKSQKLIILVSANTTKQDLQRLQVEVKKYNCIIDVKDVQWKDDNTLKSISYYLKIDTVGSVGQIITLNDLNRFNCSFLYKAEKSAGGIANSEMTIDLIKSHLPDSNLNEEEYIVLASFLDHPVTLKELAESKALENNNALFEKEKKWMALFNNDIEKNSSTNLFQVNGNDADIQNAKYAFEYGDIWDIVVQELDNGKVQFNFYIGYKTGYHMITRSGIGLSTKSSKVYNNKESLDNDTYVVKSGKENKNLAKAKATLLAKLKEAKLNAATYYLDGKETKMTLEDLDPTLVRHVTVEHGNNFDDDGKHLGQEVRVLFKSI